MWFKKNENVQYDEYDVTVQWEREGKNNYHSEGVDHWYWEIRIPDTKVKLTGYSRSKAFTDANWELRKYLKAEELVRTSRTSKKIKVKR